MIQQLLYPISIGHLRLHHTFHYHNYLHLLYNFQWVPSIYSGYLNVFVMDDSHNAKLLSIFRIQYLRFLAAEIIEHE